MFHEAALVYVVAVLAGGIVLAARVAYWLRKSTERRRKMVERRQRFDAVRTDSPVENSDELAKERAIESIEANFSVIRSMLVPLILVGTGMLAALPYLSRVPGSVLSLAAAALTVVLGIAARPWVENAIAGLVISFSRLINIGDTVRLDNWYGTVEDISTTHTTIKVWDWRRYVVPNSRMLQSNFLNYSLTDRYQWAYVEFFVSYEADLNRVRDIAVDAAASSGCFANYEPPRFWVMGLDKEAIKCWVAAWADTPSDAWVLTHDIRTALVRDFQREGIHAHGYHHDLGTPPVSLLKQARS